MLEVAWFLNKNLVGLFIKKKKEKKKKPAYYKKLDFYFYNIYFIFESVKIKYHLL